MPGEGAERKKKKRGAIFWLKGLALLLIVMLIFTIASRIADTFTVAKVSVETAAERRIRHTVSAAGRIEQNREMAVLTEDGIIVERVEVREGEAVSEGDLLFSLSMESLSEQADALGRQIRSLQLQNEAIGENRSQDEAKRKESIARANEDYADTARKNEEAVGRAEQELAGARDALAQAEAELKRAQEELARAGEEAAGQAADGSAAEETVKEAEERVREAQSACDACREAAGEKEAALTAAQDTQREEEKSAARALDDAQAPQAADNSLEMNALTMEELQIKLEKMDKLIENEGKITAPAGGVITGIFVGAGQKTTDTAAVTMSDESAGICFSAQIGKEDLPYVAAGDTVTLTGTAGNAAEAVVASVEADESGASYTVTAELDSDAFRPGEAAVMRAVRETEEYPCTVPSTALMQEERKMFVYVLDTENTVLGQQYVVRRTEVTVLDKNDGFAAIDAAALGQDSQVVTETDRFLEAGERVRLTEE